MENIRTLIYDDKTAGRKVLPFPPGMPADAYIEPLLAVRPTEEETKVLFGISEQASVYAVSYALVEYLSASPQPHIEIMRIAALAADGEVAGLRLLHAALLAIPTLEMAVDELGAFRSVSHLMELISRKEAAGEALKESEEWFKRKVMMLSISQRLPNAHRTSADEPWTGWAEGVRLAIVSPDRQWENAVTERLKVELEAYEHRLRTAAASLNPEKNERLLAALLARSEETRWKLTTIGEAESQRYGSSLFLRQRMGEHWDSVMDSLRQSEAGAFIAALFEIQAGKVHSHPQLRTGSALIHSLILHPVLRRSNGEPDFLSCTALYLEHAGRGIFELLLPKGIKLDQLIDLPGFLFKGRLLQIDLGKVPPAQFVEEDGSPRDIDWTDIKKIMDASFKSLVMIYMDNDNFLAELLNNPKAIGKPGVVALIAQRCRSLRILSIIANRRELYTGFANKEVPRNLLTNPAKVPLSSLRKFVHVRYVDKMTLQRLTNRGRSIREEVRREIMSYLNAV